MELWTIIVIALLIVCSLFFAVAVGFYCAFRRREDKKNTLGTPLEKVKIDSRSEKKASTPSTQSSSFRQPDLRDTKQSAGNVRGKQPAGTRKVASEPIAKSPLRTCAVDKRRRAESEKEFEERKAALKKHILREAEKKKALKEYVLGTLSMSPRQNKCVELYANGNNKSKWSRPPKENTKKVAVVTGKKKVIVSKPSNMPPRRKQGNFLAEVLGKGRHGTDSRNNFLPSS